MLYDVVYNLSNQDFQARNSHHVSHESAYLALFIYLVNIYLWLLGSQHGRCAQDKKRITILGTIIII